MKNIGIFRKKIGKLLVALTLSVGLIFTSCQDIIELEPFNQISESVAFSTPEYVALSVIGMYQAAQLGEFGGGRGYPFGAAFVQQGDNRGEDVINWYAFYAFTYQGTYTPTTANNVFYWSDTYRLINRCNIIVDGVKTAAANGVISQAKADEYEGEARLLRAAAYHELLKMFARPYRHTADASHMGVPYHKTPFIGQSSIDAGFATGRHSVAECYGFIIEDLEFAETHLPLKAERTGNVKITRGTKEAAAAYKMRVYQHMWDMPKVITEGLKFITGTYAGSYSLDPNVWVAFANNLNNNEYIFGMENAATNYPTVNGALASQYNTRNLVSISPIIWRHPRWLKDDKRRAWTDDLEQDDRMVRYIVGRLLTDKYKKGVTLDDTSPMMRYPEVLLNLAEAYAREGQAANALTYLNLVRNRSLANPGTQAYDLAADFSSDPVQVLGAILDERRIELLMEGSRWPDIHRLQQCPHFPIAGVPAKLSNSVPPAEVFYLEGSPWDPFAVFQAANPTYVPNPVYMNDGPYEGPKTVNAIPYNDHRFIWPIPQNELNANPTLKEQQNPGY